MKPYRIGILGLRMGHRWADGTARLKDARLEVVYDPDREQADKVAAQYHTRAAPTEDAFFETGLDIVIVATPDPLHVPQSVRALSLGRHVICEKPMAATVKDCQVINEAVRRSRKRFMIGQVCRYTPAFQLARRLIREGRIGEIVFIESEYYHDYSRVGGIGGWRKDPAVRREGFIGGGCHALDLIRWLAGDPVEVACYMNHKYLPDWPTNDTRVAIAKFPGGAIGKVFVSIGVKAGYSMRTVIHGTTGSIVCDNMSSSLTLYDGSYRQMTGARPWVIPVVIGAGGTEHAGVAAEVAEFVECLKAGKNPPTDNLEGTRTIAFGEACLVSARTGRPVKVARVPAATPATRRARGRATG